jgi:hypothetical protein
MNRLGPETKDVISFLDLKARWGTFWGGEANGNIPNRYNRLSAKLGELSAAGSEHSGPIELNWLEQRLADRAVRFADEQHQLMASEIISQEVDEKLAILRVDHQAHVRSFGEIATSAQAQVAPLVASAAALAQQL